MRSYAITTPSDVETLLTVASSIHGPAACRTVHGTEIDRLSDPDQALRFFRAIRQWFREHASTEIALRLPQSELRDADLQQLRCLRSAVRALVDEEADRFGLELDALQSRYEFALAIDGQLHATASGWQGFIAELLLPLMALAQRPGRVRVCARAHCGWVIFDRSARGAQRYCRTHRRDARPTARLHARAASASYQSP